MLADRRQTRALQQRHLARGMTGGGGTEVSGLDHGDGPPGTGEHERRGQAGDPAADHHVIVVIDRQISGAHRGPIRCPEPEWSHPSRVTVDTPAQTCSVVVIGARRSAGIGDLAAARTTATLISRNHRRADPRASQQARRGSPRRSWRAAHPASAPVAVRSAAAGRSADGGPQRPW